MNLANLNNLLEGGADKIAKAFPRIFAEGTQAGILLQGSGKVRIGGKIRLKNFGKMKWKREVTLNLGGGKRGIVPVEPRRAEGELHGRSIDPAGEGGVGEGIPRKTLPAEKSCGQIEGRGKAKGGHGERLKVSQKRRSEMMKRVERKILLGWVAWAGLSLAQGQEGEEPIRKAERVGEEVRRAEPAEEAVRKAELAEQPKEATGLSNFFSSTPRVTIQSPEEGQVMPWETVDVFMQVENLAVGEGEHRLHVILDNGSPMEHGSTLKPVILRGLAPGAHSLRVYAVRPDGKMVGKAETWVRRDFFVRRQDFSNFQPREHAYLTVNLPMDGKVMPDEEGKIWLDFLAHGAPLGAGKFRVRAVMNGVETIVSTRDPHPWGGLAEGRHRVVIELIDEDGDAVAEIFARVERTFEITRTVRAVNPREVDSANLWLRNRQ